MSFLGPVLRRFALGLLLLRALDGRLQAEPPGALSVIDAYLTQAARTDPAYRSDIRSGPAQAGEPGRFAASGPVLGPFTYRPKTYRELTVGQRVELLRSPAFRRFLAARGRAGHFRLSISPEEMRRNRAFVLRLDPP